MDIGLGLNGTHLGSGPGPGAGDETVPVPGPLAPIPGILDAPAVVVLGASIMESAFEDAGDVFTPAVAAYGAAAGFTGTFYSYANAGHGLGLTLERAILADTDLAATRGANLYLMHSGGNSIVRPYANPVEFGAEYDAVMDQILGNPGDKMIPMPLTLRYYGKDTGYTEEYSVNPDIPESLANGSGPFNDNLIIPRIRTRTPEWCEADARPFVDPYAVGGRHPWVIGSDGIHGYGASLARFILARVSARARGLRPGVSRSGKAFVYAIRAGDPKQDAIGPVNTFYGFPNNATQNNPLLYGAISADGIFDPFIELWRPRGLSSSGGSGVATDAATRVADARLHGTLDMYLTMKEASAEDPFELNLGDLVPGDVMTLKACGTRASTASNRKVTLALTVGGVTQTLVMDAASNVASNMVTFDPVTIPADGRATLTAVTTVAGGFGYLSGILIDFG
jgi:hypothetical protein